MNGSLLIKSTGVIGIQCDGYFAGEITVNGKTLTNLVKELLPCAQGDRTFTGDLMLTICRRELTESSCDLFEEDADAKDA